MCFDLHNEDGNTERRLILEDRGPSARQEWRDNWKAVLAGGCGMALAAVPAYTIGVVIQPLQNEFGWTRAEISAGPMIPSVVAVFLGPVIGWWIDRYGPRRLAVLGVIISCLSMGLLSTTTSSIWSWWLLWALTMTTAAMLTKPVIWIAATSSLFDTGRGFALAVTLCGAALPAILIPSFVNYLDEQYGWRGAFIILATVCGVVLMPVVLLFFTSNKDKSSIKNLKMPPDTDNSNGDHVPIIKLITSFKFICITFAALLMVMSVAPILLNMVPILFSLGHSRTTATIVAGVIGFGTTSGRLVSGYLLDRLNGNLICAGSALLPIVSSVLLLSMPGSLEAAIIATLFLGLAAGAEWDSVSYLVSRHFDLRNFGILFGTLGGLLGMVNGVGPVLVSYIFDVTHSYNLALMLQAPLCIFAAVLFLALGPYTPEMSRSDR
jgi:MFS family permease